jgi:hypothetical protein
MRHHVILSVISALQGHEIKNIGFNMEPYCAPSSEFHDWLGGNNDHVCDIAGWTTMLFTSAGIRRNKPLTVAELKGMALEQNLITHTASAMGISEETTMMLCAPWVLIDMFKLEPSRISLDIAVDVLKHFLTTGNVEWGDVAGLVAA